MIVIKHTKQPCRQNKILHSMYYTDKDLANY